MPVFCSSELSGECWPKTEDSTCVGNKAQLVQSQENLSVCNKPKLQICKERNEQPLSRDDKGFSQSKAGASQRKECNIEPGTEFSEHPGHQSEEMSQGEVILVLTPKQMHPSKVPHRGSSVDQTATTCLVEGSTTTLRPSRGPGRDESHCKQMQLKETMTDDTVLSLQASLVHSSSLILRDGPMVSDLAENHTARRESSHCSPVQNSEPDEAGLHPSSVQSDEFLPTFTSQRPTYLAARNTSSSNAVKQRYGSKLHWFL